MPIRQGQDLSQLFDHVDVHPILHGYRPSNLNIVVSQSSVDIIKNIHHPYIYTCRDPKVYSNGSQCLTYKIFISHLFGKCQNINIQGL
jgi:hypothetical protein